MTENEKIKKRLAKNGITNLDAEVDSVQFYGICFGCGYFDPKKLNFYKCAVKGICPGVTLPVETCMTIRKACNKK